MKNIYFDICAIPFYLLILWTCYSRKLTKGHANRLFITMNWTSLFCVFADIAMEFVVNPVLLSPGRVAAGMALSFSYKLLRNGGLVIYLLYIFAITRTDYRLRPLRNRLLLWLPNAVLTVTLLQNFLTRNVFTVTAEGGYARGPLLMLFYVIAMGYALFGACYCVYCKRYLTTGKWIAILSVYVMTFVGVIVQLFFPHYLVEMICTSVGVTMILLLVTRPEETMDSGVGIQNFKTTRPIWRSCSRPASVCSCWFCRSPTRRRSAAIWARIATTPCCARCRPMCRASTPTRATSTWSCTLSGRAPSI